MIPDQPFSTATAIPHSHRSGIVATPSHAIRRHMQHDATLHTHSQPASDTQPATHSQRHNRSGHTIYNDTHSQLQHDMTGRQGMAGEGISFYMAGRTAAPPTMPHPTCATSMRKTPLLRKTPFLPCQYECVTIL